MLALVSAVPARAAAADATPSLDATALSLMPGLKTTLGRTVESYRTRSSGTDPRYYADGDWINGNPACWVCRTGPGLGAAALVDTQPDLLPLVVATMNRAITDHQVANGSFTSTDNSAGINTTWFVNNLGTVYLLLGDKVDAVTRARWASSIAAGVDFLLNNRETVWYVNGNINLAYTQSLWLAWTITGVSRYRTAYEASWEFTLRPPQPRWTGFGLVVERAPTRTDGADGSGYLSEGGGFDPDYAQLQLDVLAAFYAVSREPRALWLMNVLMNKELTRVDSTWTLDARNGSRHSLLEPFMTSAMSVLALSGSRPDLVARLGSHLARVDVQYRNALTFTHINFYRGVGSWLGTPLTYVALAGQTPIRVAEPVSPAPSTVASRVPATATPSAPATPRATVTAPALAPIVYAPARVSVRSRSARVTVSTGSASRRIRSVALLCGSQRCGRAVARSGAHSADAGTIAFTLTVSRRWALRVRRTGGRSAQLVVTLSESGRTWSRRQRIDLER